MVTEYLGIAATFGLRPSVFSLFSSEQQGAALPPFRFDECQCRGCGRRAYNCVDNMEG